MLAESTWAFTSLILVSKVCFIVWYLLSLERPFVAYVLASLTFSSYLVFAACLSASFATAISWSFLSFCCFVLLINELICDDLEP
ncbi:hypothetical protein V2E25_00635 [Mycoplasmopsis arginini]|uniref:NADH dehydrogenase subunit 6 n=1 Tax=Mycoplasmopsis arginini TaxID=2094 RepID=A0ABZ2AIZ8_MYCAR|nr:hypothetical protein [Mycoplasmopsis arginini]WVN22096.1 hypothetical protein V2E25_00635 [Mycoplasmopsis arginini]